MYGTTINLKGY